MENHAAATLKRKVRNLETNLFEWRRCTCTITKDFQLLMELTEEEFADNSGPVSNEDGNVERDGHLSIDLATQLKKIEQKKKNKTRCELEFSVLVSNSETSKSHVPMHTTELRHEELMASSTKHCQQFIEQVRYAEQLAKRKHSIRTGTALAAKAAAQLAASSLSSSSEESCCTPRATTLTSVSPMENSIQNSYSDDTDTRRANVPVQVSTHHARSDHVNPATVAYQSTDATAELNASMRSTSSTSSTHAASGWEQKRWNNTGCEVDTIDTSISSVRAGASSDTASSSHSASPISQSLDPPLPLPPQLFAQRLGVFRSQHSKTHEPISTQDLESDEDDSDFDDESKYLEIRRKKQLLLSPTHTVRRVPSRIRPRSTTTTPTRILPQSSHSTATAHSPAAVSATAAAAVANLNRLRLRNHPPGVRFEDIDDCGDNEDADSRAELNILIRVESTLRQLEEDNAQAREREMRLTQEVQALRDALRLKTAEKKHIEREYQQVLREKEEWQHAAQRAQTAMTQMEEELLIAQEETQLLKSEKLRLKHQNKELLTQVHRLDSLVYGRF